MPVGKSRPRITLSPRVTHIRKHLTKLDTYESMGLIKMHTFVLVNVIVRQFSTIYEHLGCSEQVSTWEKNLIPVFKKSKNDILENCRPVSLTLVHGKVLKPILEAISKHTQDKKGTDHCQYGFRKRKSNPLL